MIKNRIIDVEQLDKSLYFFEFTEKYEAVPFTSFRSVYGIENYLIKDVCEWFEFLTGERVYQDKVCWKRIAEERAKLPKNISWYCEIVDNNEKWIKEFPDNFLVKGVKKELNKIEQQGGKNTYTNVIAIDEDKTGWIMHIDREYDISKNPIKYRKNYTPTLEKVFEITRPMFL